METEKNVDDVGDFLLGESLEEALQRNEELAAKNEFQIKKSLRETITEKIPPTKPVDENLWKQLYLKQVEITNLLLEELKCYKL
jgi:hypothetical protein